MGKRKGDRKDRYRGKSYYPKYIQDKLAITFLVMILGRDCAGFTYSYGLVSIIKALPLV